MTKPPFGYEIRRRLANVIEPPPYGKRSFLIGLRRMVARRLLSYDAPYYCDRCFACGEPGCCSPKRCDNGAFCARYYGNEAERKKMSEEWDKAQRD